LGISYETPRNMKKTKPVKKEKEASKTGFFGGGGRR
jgi:hypothetical protein